MPTTTSPPRLTGLRPLHAIAGGRVTLDVSGVSVTAEHVPWIRVGTHVVPPAFASSREVKFVIPADIEGGQTPIRLEDLPGETIYASIGRVVATGLHQVDSPVIDRQGNLYVTYSGTRGQQSTVSIYRVRPDGVREVFVTGVTNATSMAFDPEGRLHVSSRFEGAVLRIGDDGAAETIATDLGVATGLAFTADGVLYVGDRSGAIFRLLNGYGLSSSSAIVRSRCRTGWLSAVCRSYVVDRPRLDRTSIRTCASPAWMHSASPGQRESVTTPWNRSLRSVASMRSA